MGPTFWTVVAAVLGAGVLVLAALAWRRGEFDAEVPKYEMLGVDPPAPARARPEGSDLGITDRVVRLGLLGAVLHYASAAGWVTGPGVVLSLAGLWLAVTGLKGRDPLVGWVRQRL